MSIVDVTDPELDLDTQIKAHRSEVTPLVEPGPKLVVGQGEHSSNYTLIRCLDEYGVPYLQFMAYPSSVRGGVAVNSGELFSDAGLEIVASPISSANATASNIRIFTDTGLLKSQFKPAAPLTPPFVVAVADFLGSHSGDEIAVASRYPTNSSLVRFYDASGAVLAEYPHPLASPAQWENVRLSPVYTYGGAELLIGCPTSGLVYTMDPADGSCQAYDNSAIGSFSYVAKPVAHDILYSVGSECPATTESTVRSRTADGIRITETAQREKCFFISPAAGDTAWSDSTYVKRSLFRHLRTDYSSPGYIAPGLDFDNNDYDHWAGGAFNDYITSTQADYFSNVPSAWEPCFTHRHADWVSTAWHDRIDPVTGLNQYMMLSRNNTPATYVEGTTTFNALTYAPNLPAIDHLYIWPLRAYLLKLAEKFRGVGGNPEKLVAVEPNHEMEIYVPQDSTIGDYNTRMISGFLDSLLRRYGTLAYINTKFGTSFTSTSFDAPRNTNRGSWDAYSTSNPFYNAWVEYNRKVVLTRIAQGEREALMAGFPPAAIKTHQIPANYAVGPVISGQRITPIDWIIGGACGYGGGRYGIWYTGGDYIYGAQTSGFNMIDIGEYHPLTTSQYDADIQAQYIFNNGVNFITSMTMDPIMDSVAQNAYLKLRALGPRPLTSQGTSQLRPVWQPRADGSCKHYDIVCIGKTGLLKSINSDGSWEGTVYTEPFR